VTTPHWSGAIVPGFALRAGRPFPIEQLHGPNLIRVVIAVIFLGILIYALFKW
jgi:hypothetical protein